MYKVDIYTHVKVSYSRGREGKEKGGWVDIHPNLSSPHPLDS